MSRPTAAFASRAACGAALVLVLGLGASAAAASGEPSWTKAHLAKPAMTADETRAFMKRLARFVYDNHLKRAPKSPQRGMVYEYFQVARKGKFDQWVQGEALDTMHDGAWLAAAMVNAFRATGESFYKDFLTKWQLPFYTKMLNHSDELFLSSDRRNDARAGAAAWGKPWAFQAGEKGFIPYFWDDGASVSLERREPRNRRKLGHRPCVDFLAGKPNPHGRLDGYSQGMSNHMAQDIGVMAQLAWLLLKDGASPADRELAAEVAQAARNLHECRVRHWGVIPMCAAPAALACRDAKLMRRVPGAADERLWQPSNHYTRALRDFPAGKDTGAPGFADDQQYRYYFRIARSGGRVPKPLAFKTIYDACTEPMLWRCYSDDAPVPAGVNKFDLYPFALRDGKPTHYRSERKGPGRRPIPIGSRMGPQNMVCCGWALQMLRAFPGVWEERYKRRFAKDLRVYIAEPPPVRQPGGGWALGDPTDTGPLASAKIGGAELLLGSRRDRFVVRGSAKGEELGIRIFDRPDGKGTHAIVTLQKGQDLRAVNGKGQPLRIHGRVDVANGRMRFRFHLPYTFVRGQAAWANGVEHARYSLRVGKDTRNFYLASSEKQVAKWLEHELAGGLRTWEAIFDKYGYVPTGLGTGRFWDGFSDSGGYAHLISAAAQWLLCLQGKADWRVHSIPAALTSGA
jgi:hypothetical protein